MRYERRLAFFGGTLENEFEALHPGGTSHHAIVGRGRLESSTGDIGFGLVIPGDTLQRECLF